MGETRASTRPVGVTTRLSVNGSTSLVVTPPLPCGLVGCVAELHITGKHGDTNRVHLNAQQRGELIAGLGGTSPVTLSVSPRCPTRSGLLTCPECRAEHGYDCGTRR